MQSFLDNDCTTLTVIIYKPHLDYAVLFFVVQV